MSRKARVYTWYVEPQSTHTNMVLSQQLVEEHCLEGKICDDGEPHNLWECPDHEFVSRLERDRYDQGIDFTIFVQEGEGEIRKWGFQPKTKRTRRKYQNHFAR